MIDSEPLQELQALRAGIFSGRIGIDEAYDTFERMTYMLIDVARSDARTLKHMVNEIEIVRFCELPEDRPAAVREILVKAEPIFERYSGFSG